MSQIEMTEEQLRAGSKTWLVTGAAGFIGSHLVERLLGLGQRVVGLDDFSTGKRANLDGVMRAVGTANAGRFELVEGDIRDLETCRRACKEVELVLHQAALGSVPRSIEDPRRSHDVNVTGFMNVLLAARDAGIKRVVYASSSSVYGDHPALPKIEANIGNQLSPYAVTKYADELYASVFGKAYGLELLGLRYFNVFGPRQDPEGPYAAVMPRWFAALLAGREVSIYGDGETSRDFCFVENVVQVNLLAATVTASEALGQVYNVACGERTTLKQLFELIRAQVARFRPDAALAVPAFKPFRAGDIRHSLAEIGKASRLLGYVPTHGVRAGLEVTCPWYATALGRG
jgi:UDP-N-acetylglucosamine 4-epimerase